MKFKVVGSYIALVEFDATKMDEADIDEFIEEEVLEALYWNTDSSLEIFQCELLDE